MAKKKFSAGLTFIACLLALAIGFIAAFFLYTYIQRPKGGDVYSSGELSIHFMELGNNYTGDSIYIRAGDTDILIDAGSRTNSAEVIDSYLQTQMNGDRTLEYVIATHAHQDHIAGFAGDGSNKSLFELYECETIIDFPQTEATSGVYKNYIAARNAEIESGAKHYTALECCEGTNGAQQVYEIAPGIEMKILYHDYYREYPGDENNCSVCVLLSQGDNYFLLTGDLEAEGEESLVKNNPDLPKVKLFKAGHHGSYTASSDALLEKIQPEIVCVCCCAGSIEYTQNLARTFPAQEAVDRISEWTDEIYVTTVGSIEFDESKDKYVDTGFRSMNGNIVVSSRWGKISVDCSNNNIWLKDTDWYKERKSLIQESQQAA